MKSKDIRTMSDAELATQLQEQSALLASLKYSHGLSPIENPNRLSAIRKDIARIKTEQHARVLAGKSNA